MTGRRYGYGLVPLFTLAAILYQSVASAGLVRIAPVRVDLNEATHTAVVELSNPGDTPMSIQVDAVTWRQSLDGTDHYESTTDILAFPPIFTIPVGESQLVRIGRTAPQSAEREQAYRLYFTELPPPPDDSKSGLRMRLRISIPLFSSPLAPRPGLRVVGSEYEDGRLNVTLRNTGNTHLRVSDFFAAERPDLDSSEPVRYVLPGATTEYSLEVPAGAVVSTVQVVTDELGTMAYDLDTGLAVVPTETELASR